MQTIRVAQNDIYTGSYVLKDAAGVPLDLSAATPHGVTLYVTKVDDGSAIGDVECLVTTSASGLVKYTIDDSITANKVMGLMTFVVTTTTNTLTAPGGQEQGLWVY
jgi:hypothetical protein